MDEPKDIRLHLMISRSEAAAIDDWRFRQRVASRSEAVRQLVAAGLGGFIQAAPTAQAPAVQADRAPSSNDALPGDLEELARVPWKAPDWAIEQRHYCREDSPRHSNLPGNATGYEVMVAPWLEGRRSSVVTLDEVLTGAFNTNPDNQNLRKSATRTMAALGWRSVTQRSQRGVPRVFFVAGDGR